MADMMTPEEINDIREWTKTGNEWRPPRKCKGLPMDAMRERWGGVDGNEFQLNSAGLAIAALAEALEQANETAEELTAHKEKGRVTPEQFAKIETMRANKRRLLG